MCHGEEQFCRSLLRSDTEGQGGGWVHSSEGFKACVLFLLAFLRLRLHIGRQMSNFLLDCQAITTFKD